MPVRVHPLTTRHQRHRAIAATPPSTYPLLRSAEPDPATPTQRAELTLTPQKEIREIGQWIKDLTAARREFARNLAERQSLTIPAEDPAYEDLGPAFPAWTSLAKDAILQPPKPEIKPSEQILDRAISEDPDMEAAN